MELSIIVKELGLRGAQSHRTYETMVATWIDPSEPIPSLEQCQTKWDELMAAGFFEPSYDIKRQQAYIAAGLTMERINELTAEYTQAVAANDSAAIAKYQAALADIFTQRQAIKDQYPKP